MGEKFNLFYDQFITQGGYSIVIEGLGVTILLTIFAMICGLIIGTLIAIILTSKRNCVFYKLSTYLINAYVSFFRGTPIIVQLLFIYFVILPLIGLGSLNALFVACCIFGLNSGAYVSEIMRSAILSVDSGQNEAARALGLSANQSLRFVVFPQSFKNALPSLGNEFVTLLKETSVANVIAVHDLTYAFSKMGGPTYELMVPYFFLAFCYFVLVLIATSLSKKLERRLREGDKY